MLKLLPEWTDAVVVRTRDEAELAKCDVVVDVGGIYDPATLRFDHHQKTFHDTLSEESFSTRLSSAGLVYRHFGKRILKLIVKGSGIPEEVVDKKLYAKVYKVCTRLLLYLGFRTRGRALVLWPLEREGDGRR